MDLIKKEVVKDEGKILAQFFIDKNAHRYIFKSGKTAEFFGGVYRTDISSEIAELQAEIKAGIGSIWQVAGQENINSLELDPMAVLKKKIIADYEADKARANANGESVSDVTPAKPHGTGTVGVAAAVSNSIGAATAVKPGSINFKK